MVKTSRYAYRGADRFNIHWRFPSECGTVSKLTATI